jgi:3-hydroxyisobutyrate dehydrogenase-like beta-hydroxyacid dehydrogenase
MVSGVTVLGLGMMGSALARTLAVNGCRVTVWNRHPEKAAPLAAQGAMLARTPSAAIAASPVLIVCVSHYAAAQQILIEGGASLAGKVLVQLSTGTPLDARTSEAWAHQHQLEYFEGKITGGPDTIGTPSAHILLSGAEAVFRKAEPLLQILAGRLDDKGAEIGLAAAWDMVLLMRYHGVFLSLFHSIQICQAEGIPLDQYTALLGEQGKGYEKWLCDNIKSGSYGETSAPLELWASGIERIVQQAQDSQINGEFPLFTAALFHKAMAAGYGREEVSALFKVLQKS